MPELPEVETVRRVLNQQIIGLKILDVEIRYSSIIDGDTDEFKNKVINKSITNIDRYGKFLIFNLNEGNIISHLRMEGKYFYVNNMSIDNKHIHVIYHLSNGYMLCYQDVRKFGRMVYKNTDELYISKPLIDVGVDPILSNDINHELIYKRLKNKNIPIKTALLDQSILCGLGNIYVDEVLFTSRINPLLPSNEVTLEMVSNIIKNSVEILSLAIEKKGTTIRSYTSSLNVTGEYQNFLKVHTKKVCPNCNEKIEKIRIGGRGTYYCKKCQS